jgi:hypothetical protein
MITRNSRATRLISALLGASLSIALISGAHADDDWQQNEPRVLQAANGVDITNNDAPVATAGVLVRSPSQIEARMAMSGLEAGHVYTIWWMIFNRPQNCTVKNACGVVDLTTSTGQPDPEKIKATGATVFNGTGFLAGADGTANVTVLLKAGPLPIGNGIAAPAVSGYLWPNNGLNAFIITVIRAHAAPEIGRMSIQMSQVEPAPIAGGTCVECFDHQAIVFGTATAALHK